MDFHRRLRKANVVLVDDYRLVLRCNDCGEVWWPIIQTGGPMPRGYWKCPQGCNTQ